MVDREVGGGGGGGGGGGEGRQRRGTKEVQKRYNTKSTTGEEKEEEENITTYFQCWTCTVIASPITVTIVSIWKEITTVKGKLYVFCFAFRMHGIEIFTQSGVSNVNAQPRIFIDRFND